MHFESENSQSAIQRLWIVEPLVWCQVHVRVNLLYSKVCIQIWWPHNVSLTGLELLNRKSGFNSLRVVPQ